MLCLVLLRSTVVQSDLTALHFLLSFSATCVVQFDFPEGEGAFGPFYITSFMDVTHGGILVNGYNIRLKVALMNGADEAEAWFLGGKRVMVKVPAPATFGGHHAARFIYYKLIFEDCSALDNSIMSANHQLIDFNTGNIDKTVVRHFHSVTIPTARGRQILDSFSFAETSWNIAVAGPVEQANV